MLELKLADYSTEELQEIADRASNEIHYRETIIMMNERANELINEATSPKQFIELWRDCEYSDAYSDEYLCGMWESYIIGKSGDNED